MCPDISPSQMQINAARRRNARLEEINNRRAAVDELQVRLENAEARPLDPIKAALVGPLRERLELARGALQAAIEHDERLSAGVSPASPEKIAADAQFCKERDARRNREKTEAQAAERAKLVEKNRHLYGPRASLTESAGLPIGVNQTPVSNWPPAAAIEAGAVATEKRGRGRPRKVVQS